MPKVLNPICPHCQAPLPERTFREVAQALGRRAHSGFTAAERRAQAVKAAAARVNPGRKKIPTPCARCHQVLPSAREAWAHCLNRS